MTIHFFLNEQTENETLLTTFNNIESNPFKIGDKIQIDAVGDLNQRTLKLVEEYKEISLLNPPTYTIHYYCDVLLDNGEVDEEIMSLQRNPTKVKQVTSDEIIFEDGSKLYSHHDQDWCEHHWLDFEHIKLEEFDGLEFDLSGDSFFNRIDDYGIELVPIHGYSVKIPGYGSNNGYYSSELTLVLVDPTGNKKRFDISDCQVISE